MKVWQRITIAVAFSLPTCFCFTLFGDDESEKVQNPRFENATDIASAKSSIVVGKGGYPEADFDLGSLVAGKPVKARLELFNPTNQDFPIAKLTTSCGCLKLAALGDSIPAQGSVEFSLILDVPPQASTPNQVTHFTLYYDQADGFVVRLNYSLRELLAFSGKGFITKAPPKSVTHLFEIPFVVTAPFSISELQVRVAPTLGDMKANLIERNGATFVGCNVGSGSAKRTGIIELVHPGSGKSASIMCIIEMEGEAQISPSIIRFVPDSERTRWHATGLLKVHKSLLKTKLDRNGSETIIEPSVRWSAEGWELQSALTQLTPEIYRFNLEATPTSEDESEKTDLNSVNCTLYLGRATKDLVIRSVSK
jgi:hypothetical protein